MKKLTLVALLCCALVAAGTAAAALSPSQYRKQANAICLDMHQKLNRLAAPKTTKAKDVVPYFEHGFAITGAAIQKVRRLSPPASLAAGHKKVVSLILQQDTLLHRLLAQIKGGADVQKALGAADATLTKLSNSETATWRKLGAAECAKNS